MISVAQTRTVMWAVILGFIALGGGNPASAANGKHLGERPKIGLALSGGGARGAAHIGVIRFLEEQQVPIDFIAGTSVGAVVGGFYAAGMTPSEIEEELDDIDWTDVFIDQSSRTHRTFRRKRDDDLYLIKHKPGFNDGKLTFAMGLVQGQKIARTLSRALIDVASITKFDDLTIPFRAVASDIVTGNAVVLDSGNLAEAIRASMSIPTVITPVEINGQLLVDGGVANNLPVDVVRAMGADIVIAVDISTPLAERSAIDSVLAVTKQLTGLLTRRNVEEQIESLDSSDILIVPSLTDIATADFADYALAIPSGWQAADEQRDRIRPLSLSDDDYRDYRAGRHSPDDKMPVINRVELVNRSAVSDDYIRARLGTLESGQPLDIGELESRISDVYGTDLFQTVQYSVDKNGTDTSLEITVDDRSWGPAYLQLGAEYDSNTNGENLFNLAGSYISTAINPSGGEWRTGLQIGSEPAIFTEFHQPLGDSLMYFVNPSIGYRERIFSVVRDEDVIASLDVKETIAELAAGRELGTWGEVRAGVRYGSGESSVRIGDPGLIDYSFKRAETYLRFSLDELDSLNFPRTGTSATVEWLGSHKGLGADTSFDQLRVSAGAAITRGANTLLAVARYKTTMSGNAPLQNVYALGGFGQLSGLSADERRGQHSTLGVLAAYRHLNRDATLPIYAGVTLEHGNVWASRRDISFKDSLFAGSVWLGADTFFGPAYLAYGQAEGGRRGWYFFLGQPF
ncbi:patatin-like phospholipase family protein [Woeseia oceani]|nr:patatin-like phospholipase family protein [Woeseia oceani]